MKKFEIKDMGAGIWLVSHNEVPKFTCRFENKKFHYERTIRDFPIRQATKMKSGCWRKWSNGSGGTTGKKPMDRS